MTLNARPHFNIPTGLVKVGLVMLLSFLAIVTVVPTASHGQWPWMPASQPPLVEPFRQLQQGLPLPGWTILRQRELSLNQQTWFLFEYARPVLLLGDASAPQSGATLIVFMRPQRLPNEQPGVEWLDINSARNLSASSDLSVVITTTGKAYPGNATAQLVRTHNQKQTFAALQWYAWPQGGHPNPGIWFWQNQWSQFKHRNPTPWIAVAAFMVMDPLVDLADYRPLAVEVGTTLQRQLDKTVFTEATQP